MGKKSKRKTTPTTPTAPTAPDAIFGLDDRECLPCVSDEAYDRMLSKLHAGAETVASFTSVVCEKDADGNCICDKITNYLGSDGRLKRTIDGAEVDVMRGSEAVEMMRREDTPPTAGLHIYYKGFETKGYVYVEQLKGMVDTLLQVAGTRIRVHVHLDGNGMSGGVMSGEPPPRPTTAQEMHRVIEGVYAQFVLAETEAER